MKKSIQFIILTFAVSWAAAGIVFLLGMRDTSSPIYGFFAMAYMFLPALCVVLLQLIHKEKPFSNLNISFRLNWWFLIAGIVPFVYTFLTLGINLLFPDISFSSTFFSSTYEELLASLSVEQAELVGQQLAGVFPIIILLSIIVNSLIAGYTINAFFGLGEEIGWRGYLLKALKNKKLLPVSLIIGVVWGIWHFPLILLGHNYPEHPVLGVGMMIIFCVLLTPMMIYIVIKSKSVLTAAIFHGTNNAIAGLPLLFLVGGSDLTVGVTGVAGFIALLLVNFLFYLYDRYVTKEKVFTRVIGEY